MRGPEGPPGRPGPAGPQGPQGPKGEPGGTCRKCKKGLTAEEQLAARGMELMAQAGAYLAKLTLESVEITFATPDGGKVRLDYICPEPEKEPEAMP